MFTKVLAGLFATAALAVGAVAFETEKPVDCCAAKMACCGKDKACCSASSKLGCCEKGMKCCSEDRACCAQVQKCCTQGEACCNESKGCCGRPAKSQAAVKAGSCCEPGRRAAKTSGGDQS